VIPLLAVAAAAGLVILATTRDGLRVGNDSVEFIVSARNLLAGKGLGLIAPSGGFMPLRLHPPLYPLVLSGLDLLGLDPLAAGRWLNVALMVGLVFLAGLGVYGLTQSLPLSLASAALLAAASPMIELFSSALTEPLFIFLGLVSVMLLYRAARDHRSSHVALAGAAAGLSAVTRYPGVALLPVGAIYLGLFWGGPFRRRLWPVSEFLLIASLPILLWTGVLSFAYGTSPSGIADTGGGLWVALAPVRIAFADLLWSWFPLAQMIPVPPYRMKLALIGMGLLATLTAVALSSWRARGRASGNRGTPALRVGVLLVLVTFLYAAVVAIAYAVRNPQPDLVERTLFPVSLGLTAASLAFLAFILGVWAKGRGPSLVLSVLVLGLLLAQLPASFATARSLWAENAGLTSPGWRASCILRALSNLPADLRLISDQTAAVLLYKNVYPYEIPELEAGARVPLQRPFGQGDSGVEKLFRERQAALVLFETMIWDLDTIYYGDAAARLRGMTNGLIEVSRCADGGVYLAPSPSG
jgi:hypothetical protein